MIPGDLLSAFPHKQFNILPGLLDSWAATIAFVVPTIVSVRETITLVLSPLKALIDDQIDILRNWKFSCCKIENPDDMKVEDVEGMYDCILLQNV